MTLKKFIEGLDTIPITTSWYLTDISESKGKQDLYKSQSPQRLKSLKEHALIESAVSSNRIEGIEVDNKRIGTVIFGKSLLHDRSEEEGARSAGVSRPMIRVILETLRREGKIEALGTGRGAKWRKCDNNR